MLDLSSSSVQGREAPLPPPHNLVRGFKTSCIRPAQSGPEERVEMERRGRLSLVDSEQNNRIKETGLRGSQSCCPGHKLDQAISCCPWGDGQGGVGVGDNSTNCPRLVC